MHRAHHIAMAIAIVLTLTACDEPASPASPTSQDRLRLTLIGSARLENLAVLFPDDEVSFGSLQGGTTSAYREFPNGVYRYAAYRYTLDGVDYQQPVIDWVGEQPMEGSRFTYLLEVVPPGPRPFRINLVSVTRDQ